MANGLAMMKRRGRMTGADADQALAHLSLMPIEPDAETWPRAWADARKLADTHRLTVYDAAYLELALRRQLPLATLDKELIAAAGACGVGVV